MIDFIESAIEFIGELTEVVVVVLLHLLIWGFVIGGIVKIIYTVWNG